MDIVDSALRLATTGTPASYLLALVAGIATSIGPCVAPRYAAATAISSGGGRERVARLGAFVCGTVTMSAAVASTGSLLMQLARASSIVYWGLAVALVVSGARTLWRGETHTCSTHDRSTRTAGSAFLLGAGTSMAISPCCTPILVAFGALSGSSLGAATVAGLVAAYMIGHLAPVLFVYAAANAANDLVARYRDAAVTVGAAVTIALGLYYAALA